MKTIRPVSARSLGGSALVGTAAADDRAECRTGIEMIRTEIARKPAPAVAGKLQTRAPRRRARGPGGRVRRMPGRGQGRAQGARALSGPASGTALSVRGVGHRFGTRQALADVTLEVPRGAFVALLGPNGAGKTTLFSLVTRLYDTRSGEVRIFGYDMHREPSRGARPARRRVPEPDARRRPHDPAEPRSITRRCTACAGVTRGPDPPSCWRGRAGAIADRLKTESAPFRRPVAPGRDRALPDPRPAASPPRRADRRPRPRVARRDRRDRARARARRGVSRLWATHIFDEVEPDDPVVVLHEGRVLAARGPPEIAGRTAASATQDAACDR